MGSKKKKQKVQNAVPGLGLGLGGSIGFPGNQSTGWSEQLSQPNTAFINLRWYLISNLRQFLSQLYVEIGLVQTIVNVPVDDALNGGIELKSKELSEEQLEELKNTLDQDDDLNTVAQAEKWNRLFGGAAVLIITDDDPKIPLNIKTLTKDTPLEFRAVDMWELYWDQQNTEGFNPTLHAQVEFEFYDYYGYKIHKSRVLRLKGIEAPSFIRPRLRGWGVSVAEPLIRGLNQYLKATDLTFELLDEFKVDVYKINNLVNTLLSPTGAQEVHERIRTANRQKNYQSAIVMDKEDDWDHKQINFSGIAEMLEQIRFQIASEMRMPITKVFGMPTPGFNSGEADIEVYNSMVESQVRNKIKYVILKVCKIKCQQLFGYMPEDLSITFKPLKVLGAEQEENVKTQKFTRALQAKQAGEISSEQFIEICNKGGLFDISIDPKEAEGGYLDDTVDETTGEPPAADRADSEQALIANKKANWFTNLFKKRETVNSSKFVIRNKAGFKEEEHPRAGDGKFTDGSSGSSGAAAKEPEKKTTSKEEKAGKSFYTKTKEPSRENSKTPDEEYIYTKGVPGQTGEKSAVAYRSPESSTCNLVGYVAFGKAPVAEQEFLNQTIQTAEVLLSDMGIKFKTPLDFVCQDVTKEADAVASYIPAKKSNSRINIEQNKDLFLHSIMHEIGHAVDYAMAKKPLDTASDDANSDAMDSEELTALHEELREIVVSSDFYSEVSETVQAADEEDEAEMTAYMAYLTKPTEVFARGFEVFAYKKVLELTEQGKIPKEYAEKFKPDIFKAKDQRTDQLQKVYTALETETMELEEKVEQETDPEVKNKLNKKIEEENKPKLLEIEKAIEAVGEQEEEWTPIAKDKQQEYMDKISRIMTEIIKKDTFKNALDAVWVVRNNTLVKQKIQPKQSWLKKIIRNTPVFREEEHPREADGKFGEKGGSGSASSERPKIKAPTRRADVAPEERQTQDAAFLKQTEPLFKEVKALDNGSFAYTVGQWTREGYKDIRAYQQGKLTKEALGESGVANIEKQISNLQKDFDKLPDYDGPISRYLSLDNEQLAQFKVGATWETDAFSSFTFKSQDQSMTNRFDTNTEIVVDQNKSGKAIWGLSDYSKEGEVLVPKGVKYEVVDIDDSSGTTRIHVKEVAKDG